MNTKNFNTPITQDFEILLKYVGDNKVSLTPKQGFIPIRHVQAMMEYFQVKEPNEERAGDLVFKKRMEIEYPRFYFLDLLALSGSFLKITRKNILAKGPHWKTFFATPPEERLFLLFCAFRQGFHFENWFMRGGDFGRRIEENSECIWTHMMQWMDGREVDWHSWANEVIDACGLSWDAPDQSRARESMIWGLKYCLIRPLGYFEVLDIKEWQEKFGPELHSLRLNTLGLDYFRRLYRTSGTDYKNPFPFSLN